MTLSPDLIARHARLRSWNAAQNRDRLSYFRFGVARLREAYRLFTAPDPVNELHCRGPNKGNKSYTMAAYVLACLEKRQDLDGCPIPQWKGPVEAVQLVLDYKQQLLSVQPAYLRLIDGWPHKARWIGETLQSLRVMPIGGDPEDERQWSVLHFITQENKRSGVGFRADLVAFDEPPVMEILRELRKAAHAGRRGIRIISETPTKRRQWAPLLEDYGDSPRASIRRVDRQRAEVRWNLDEVAGWVLSPQEKQDLRETYRNDPLFGEDGGARWHGDYTNTEGKCPLDAEVIGWMMSLCTEPEELVWRVARETGGEGETTPITRVPVEVWKARENGKTYYLDIDPASGVDAIINGTRHNPAGMHISEKGSGDLVARWNGYLAPWSVGVMAAGLARQYHVTQEEPELPLIPAQIDIEMKDHWGVNVVRGCHAARHFNLCHEMRLLRPGEWAKEVGFDATHEARSDWIGNIQEWLAAWRAAAKFDPDGGFIGFDLSKTYARCPSRAVLNCLLDTELDERGLIVAGPGIAHGEDMVLWGQKLRTIISRSNRQIPDPPKKEPDPDARLVALIQGRQKPVHRDLPPKPRPRPRV